jgi:hypothetical protein
MWIFLNDAFLSVVEHRDDPDMLLVRARCSGHIEAVFADAEVLEKDSTDYRYSAVLPREWVALALADRVRQIAYPSFKDSIKDEDYHSAAFSAWEAMADYQNMRS